MNDITKVEIDDAGMPLIYSGDAIFHCTDFSCTSVADTHGYSPAYGEYVAFPKDTVEGIQLGSTSKTPSLAYFSASDSIARDNLGFSATYTPSFTFAAYGGDPDKGLFNIVSERRQDLMVLDGHGNLTLTGDLTVKGEIRSDTPCNVSIVHNMEFYPLFMLIAVGFLWQRKQIKRLGSELRAQRATVRAAP